MAHLGDIGKAIPVAPTHAGRQLFGAGSYPSGNTLTISGLPSQALVMLMTATGCFGTRLKASNAGVVTYYDLPDARWFLYEIGTPNAWQIDIVNGTATVTALSGSSGTVSFAWIG